MEWWCIDNEYAEASTSEDTSEVVGISDDGLAEGEREFGFDREDLDINTNGTLEGSDSEEVKATHVEALDDEDRQVDYGAKW